MRKIFKKNGIQAAFSARLGEVVLSWEMGLNGITFSSSKEIRDAINVLEKAYDEIVDHELGDSPF